MAGSSRSRAEPRRRRSAEDLSAAIVAAGLRALEERRWEGLTIADVAQRAGMSVGSVYNRFADKDELIIALHDEFLATIRADASDGEASSATSLRGCLHDAIGAHCRLLSRHEPLMRVFMHRTAVDPRLVAHASESTKAIGRRFKTRLLQHRDEIRRPDPDLAADMCFRMVHDVAARRVSRGSTFESDLELSWDRLVEELTHVCAAYLGLPPHALDRVKHHS